MAVLLGNFGAKNFSGGGKVLSNIYENPNSPRTNKFFFPNLYKLHYLYILMDSYLILWKRVCPRSSQPVGYNVKCP
jgi:hypothetical protein